MFENMQKIEKCDIEKYVTLPVYIKGPDTFPGNILRTSRREHRRKGNRKGNRGSQCRESP